MHVAVEAMTEVYARIEGYILLYAALQDGTLRDGATRLLRANGENCPQGERV